MVMGPRESSNCPSIVLSTPISGSTAAVGTSSTTLRVDEANASLRDGGASLRAEATGMGSSSPVGAAESSCAAPLSVRSIWCTLPVSGPWTALGRRFS